MSLLLFDLYSDMMFKDIFKHCDKIIAISEELFNSIKYADDTAVFSDGRHNME